MEIIPNNQSLLSASLRIMSSCPGWKHWVSPLMIEVFVSKKLLRLRQIVPVLEPFFSQEILHHSEWKKKLRKKINLDRSVTNLNWFFPDFFQSTVPLFNGLRGDPGKLAVLRCPAGVVHQCYLHRPSSRSGREVLEEKVLLKLKGW